MIRTVLAAAALASCLAAPAAAQQFVVGFDSVGAPGAFSQIFPGFQNGPHLEYATVTLDGGVILDDSLFASSATSGSNILATCDTCGLGDGPPPTGLPGSITGTFTTSVSSLSLDAINGSTAGGGTFTLTAFDAAGAVLGTDQAFLGPMGSPTSVQELGVAASAVKSFTVTVDLPAGYTFAIDTLTGLPLEGDWTDLGAGLAGSAGVPALGGSGSLAGGDVARLTLTGAAGPTTVAVFGGFTRVDLPLSGGVLVPSPDVVRFFPVGAAGVLELAAVWPVGVPTGTEVYFQIWVADAGGPFGLAASNAVVGVTP